MLPRCNPFLFSKLLLLLCFLPGLISIGKSIFDIFLESNLSWWMLISFSGRDVIDWLWLTTGFFSTTMFSVWLVLASFLVSYFHLAAHIFCRQRYASNKTFPCWRFHNFNSKIIFIFCIICVVFLPTVMCIMLLIDYTVVLTWLWRRGSVTWWIQHVKLSGVAFGGILIIVGLLGNCLPISSCNT